MVCMFCIAVWDRVNKREDGSEVVTVLIKIVGFWLQFGYTKQ